MLLPLLTLLSHSNNILPRSCQSASGIATFDLNAAGTQMKYTLNVTDIDHVIAAHIHTGKSTDQTNSCQSVYSCQSYRKGNRFTRTKQH